MTSKLRCTYFGGTRKKWLPHVLGVTTDLHDDAGHNVLEGLLQLGEAGQAGLHYSVGPLVNLGVLYIRREIQDVETDAILFCLLYRVTVSSNCRLDRLLDYVRNLVDNKLSFLLRERKG